MKLIHLICHSQKDRCFKIAGKRLPLCSRCLGVYLSLVLFTVIFWLFQFTIQERMVLFIVALAFNLPLMVDGITQFLGWRESNNSLRFITGILSGVGLALIVVKLFF